MNANFPSVELRWSFKGQGCQNSTVYFKSHEKRKTNSVLLCLSVVSDFSILSVAHSPKHVGSYWRHKSLKTSCKHVQQQFHFQKSLTAGVFTNVTATNSAFAGDYFQMKINTHLVLYWVFPAAGRCMWDWVKINYIADVLQNEVLTVFGQQWSSVALRNKINEALDKVIVLVRSICSLLVLLFSSFHGICLQ